MQPLNLSQLLLSVREHSVISVHQARNIDFSTHWNSRMNINFAWGFYSRPPLWSDDTWWDHEHAVITRSVLPGRQALFRKGERGWGGGSTPSGLWRTKAGDPILGFTALHTVYVECVWMEPENISECEGLVINEAVVVALDKIKYFFYLFKEILMRQL